MEHKNSTSATIHKSAGRIVANIRAHWRKTGNKLICHLCLLFHGRAFSYHRRSRIHRIAPGAASAKSGAYGRGTGQFIHGRIENIQPLLGHKNFQFVRDTVENETTVNHLVAGASHVFHLASAVGVQLIVDEPVRTIRTIVRGTEIVLEAAFRFNRPC